LVGIAAVRSRAFGRAGSRMNIVEMGRSKALSKQHLQNSTYKTVLIKSAYQKAPIKSPDL
jgi:hypothetical protein